MLSNMRKLIFLFFLLISFNSYSQVVFYFQNNQDTTGSQISIPVYVNGFTDIVSMQGSITFDASVISYLNVSNFNLPGMSISNFGTNQSGQGILTYSWYDASLQGVTVVDSTFLFSIDFTVIGAPGQNSIVSFSNTPTSLEVVDNSFNVLLPSYTDGLFIVTSSLNIGLEMYMDSLQSTSGSQISIPVYVNGFTDIVSMQGSITFDASVISYLNVSNFNLPGMSISNFGTNQSGQGILTYSWYDASLQGVTVVDSTFLFSIDFTVIGAPGQNSIVSFSNTPTSLEVVDNSFNVLLPSYTDGLFIVTSSLNIGLEMYMDSLQSTSGSQISIPVYVNGFTDIVSMQGSITFDASVISYLNVSNFNLPGMSISNFGTNQSGQGILTYSWYDASLQGVTVVDSTFLFSIDFTVIGAPGQNSIVSFSNTPTSLEVVDNSFNVLLPSYTDGLFIVTSSLNIGLEMYMDSLQSTSGSQISIPVYVNGFTDIVSMQGSITFDASVISYLNVSNFNLPGMSISNFGTNQSGQGILTYSWYDASLQGVTVVDSTFLFSIDFTVIGAPGQNSIVSFSNTPTSLEVVDNSFNVLLPSYTDGLFIVTSSLNIGLEMYMDSLQSTSGSQISIPVYVNGFTDIVSMQGSITFDASVISYLNVSNFNLPGMSISNFGTNQSGQGILTYSWYDASLQGVTVVDSTFLFSIDFTVIGAPGQNSSVSFSNTPTVNEIVNNSFSSISCNYFNGFVQLSSISQIYGCTGPSYCNYNPLANVDDGSCGGWAGCMDPLYAEYNQFANCDDGSCLTIISSGVCSEDSPTGLFVDGIIHSRASINWDNMNSATCVVDQYRIKYREVGTTPVTQKTMGGPVGSCTYGNQRTDKQLYNLTGATTYEYQMKAWYCGGGTSAWTAWNTFTTADDCPNVGNFTVYGANPTKATFDWDASNGDYEFVRIKMRVDTISNPMGSDWFQVGGFGVLYGTYTKNKNGLVAGETYRAQARTFCDPQGGAYFSLSWSPLVYWTQPTSVRLEGGSAITNLAIYPNPSRDVFNISFTSEGIQDLEVRVINLIGEELINESLEKFVGEYTKAIDLANYTKGVYFLEITTNSGVVNKKLILQ